MAFKRGKKFRSTLDELMHSNSDNSDTDATLDDTMDDMADTSVLYSEPESQLSSPPPPPTSNGAKITSMHSRVTSLGKAVLCFIMCKVKLSLVL